MDDQNWEILQILPEAIIIVDHNHDIQFMNASAMALFELVNGQELIGNPFKALPGGSGLMTYEERVEFINHKFVIDKAPTLERNDEQRWSGGPENKLFDFLAIPFVSKSARGFIIRVNDVTDGLSAFAYLAGLPSEMILPITSIKGYADLLLSGQLNEKEREFLTQIKSNSDKLLELRNDIVDFIKRAKSRRDH